MTDLAHALADTSSLSPYQGRDVLRTSIAVRNAGDGLSESMGIDPQELPIGARVKIILDCEVAGHNYVPIKDTQALELKQVLRAGTAMIIESDVVDAAIAAQADRLVRAREEAAGVRRLPMGEEDGLVAAHDAGEHAHDRVDECVACREEIDAEEAEDHRNGDG